MLPYIRIVRIRLDALYLYDESTDALLSKHVPSYIIIVYQHVSVTDVAFIRVYYNKNSHNARNCTKMHDEITCVIIL